MKFYQNMECRVIAELPNDESVIELATGIYYAWKFNSNNKR